MSQYRLHPVLPIFAVEDEGTHAVYVPGYVMRASPRLLEELRLAWSQGVSDVANPTTPAAAESLARAAVDAQRGWRQLHTAPFHPLCLNVQLPYACDLWCDYCYSRPASSHEESDRMLNRKAVLAALEFVVGHCAAQAAPFQLVIQGLGEPTLHWDDLRWCAEATQAAARAAGVPWSGHLSTNGQLDPARAEWVGEVFTHVTVSCDGPPEIQDVARPRRDGARSSACLPARVAVIAAGRASVEARVTVTRANDSRLCEVVQYLVEGLSIRNIRLEPVFSPAQRSAESPGPEELACLCLAACDAGARLGAEVSFASPRLTELHGEYCEAARQVVRLAPDGTAVNCLHGVCADRPRAGVLGGNNVAAGRFEMNETAVADSRVACSSVPPACANCVNIYHCTRSCPDGCPNGSAPGSYRCRFQRRLAEAWILRAAASSAKGDRPPVAGDRTTER